MLGLALSARAAELEAPRPEISVSPAAPLAGPQWMGSFDALSLPGGPAERGTLAAALMGAGVSPADLSSAARAQDVIDSAGRAYVGRLAPASASALADGELALAHLRLTQAQAALRPYLSARGALAAEAAAKPVADAARERQLLDNEGRLTRLAERLGRAALVEEAGAVRASERSASPPRLARPERSAPLPDKRPPPRAPEIREHRKHNPVARALRLAALSGSIVALFHGAAPVVFADMDETVAPSQAPASPEMIRAIAAILRSGGSYGILTGSSYEMARKNVVDPLMHELRDDPQSLSRLAIAARAGARIYGYDAKKRDFALTRVGALDGFLASRGFTDGPGQIRAVLEQTVHAFDLDARMRESLGKGLQGDPIVEDRIEGTGILTQLILVPTGKDVSKEDKAKYDAQGGRAQREEYAAFINRRLRDLGIPVEARVAGKTSIDVGVDKSLGFRALAEVLDADPRRVLWAGDSHGEYGNDAPAARMARLALNVGPHEPMFGARAYQEDDGGPEATLAYYRVVGFYARLTAWLRNLL